MKTLIPTDLTIETWLEEKRYEDNEREKRERGIPPEPMSVENSLFARKQLWMQCNYCGGLLYIMHLPENGFICEHCKECVQLSSHVRVQSLIDTNTWRPMFELFSALDLIEFNDKQTYKQRLEDAQERTKIQDAVQVGTGLMQGIPVALGVLHFDFMAGTMGSVVGEKIARLIEYATIKGLILILVSASGGARMQEGVHSLMQMGKISGALYNFQCLCHLFFISILTSPCTGGVTASFAMLGDIIIAEPKAVVAFAGRRVIEQTLGEILPPNFQTAEYLLEHGMVDDVLPRDRLKPTILFFCECALEATYRKPGASMY